jgi:hypothetical protein
MWNDPGGLPLSFDPMTTNTSRSIVAVLLPPGPVMKVVALKMEIGTSSSCWV